MVTVSASLSLCKGKHGLPLGPLTHNGPVMQIFGVFFFDSRNKLLKMAKLSVIWDAMV